MSTKQLGRLEQIPVRQIWENEALDFTPWLAQEENLQMLGDVLGIELELEVTEKNVGPIRADIVCRNTLADSEESWVLIENQLERTDHSHLGQLITYAAGLKTVTVVWIANKFTEEHRAALDWLNGITAEKFSFFGLELELWKIGSSAIAPKFNLICQPNNWARSVVEAKRQLDAKNLSEVQQQKLQFWRNFQIYFEHQSHLKSRSPGAVNHLFFPLGKTGVRLYAEFDAKEDKAFIGVHLKGTFANIHFNLLHQDREEIEEELGGHLVWDERPTTAIIKTEKEGFDFTNENEWQDCFEWMLGELVIWEPYFRNKIREFSTEDYDRALMDNFKN